MEKRNRKIIFAEIVIIIVIITSLLLFNLVGEKEVAIKGDGVSSHSFSDMNKDGVIIGCLLGTGVSEYLKENYDKAKILLYNTNEDVYAAVDSGAVNYGISYADSAKKVVDQYENVTYIKEPIYETHNSFVLPKTKRGKKILDEFNEYIKSIKKDGRYERISAKWDSLDEKNYKLEKYNITGENGVLRVVTGGSWVPKTFVYNEDVTGIFIDVVYGFCERYGYEPEFEIAAYASELAGISVGKYDLMADIAERTKEREKSTYLTEPIIYDKNLVIVHEKNIDTKTVPKKDYFIKDITDSFNKNFIVDSRWKLFAYGIYITILLALLSAFFGTIFGSIICFLRMHKNSFLTAFARLYIKIIQGTPVVVLLMVLNYIVFKNTGTSAFVVSVIGFSIDFAAYASEIFRVGIEAVPNGQIKAATALGFDHRQTFMKVILPQALIHIIPVYSGQFISMVKLTSVAGYISVQDLTKISDYVRSLTYEAFFPLITTAIIYFTLSTLLVSLLKILEKKVNPKLRDRLRGLK